MVFLSKFRSWKLISLHRKLRLQFRIVYDKYFLFRRATCASLRRKIDEMRGSVAFIINAEGIYRSRAWWDQRRKRGRRRQ